MKSLREYILESVQSECTECITLKDITKLKRLFSSSGIHIFNIVDNSSTTNPNENIYNLKIRIDPTSTKEQNQIKRIKYKLHFSGSKISLVKKK